MNMQLNKKQNDKESQKVDFVPSPCLEICVLNASDICTACYRSLDEIAAWSTSSTSEQLAIIARANNRRELCSRERCSREKYGT